MESASPASNRSTRADHVRELEQFPVEVLEAALLLLQLRESSKDRARPAA